MRGKDRREALQEALIAIVVFCGLALLCSGGPDETARLLVYLGRQAQQFMRGGLSRPGYRPKGRRARQLIVLQGLSGVGAARAARLLERFGSVRAIVTAPSDERALVPGIDGKLVNKMA